MYDTDVSSTYEQAHYADCDQGDRSVYCDRIRGCRARVVFEL